MTVFTDGSRGSSGVGAGISFNGLSEELSTPLGQIPSVFQAETFAIYKSTMVLKELHIKDREIYICFDSQAVLKALHSCRVTSKQIWECIEALNDLTNQNSVSPTSACWNTGQ